MKESIKSLLLVFLFCAPIPTLTSCNSDDDSNSDYESVQCEIPNGSFEEWETEAVEIVGSDGAFFEYDSLVSWKESSLNIFTLGFDQLHFMYKYEQADANGLALELRRQNTGENTGHIKFQCEAIPSKITGRVKFNRGSIAPAREDLTIEAYFSSSQDTLTSTQMDFFDFPPDSRQVVFNESIVSFTDFEIDLEGYDFAGEQVEYAHIRLLMSLSNALPTSETNSTAVIDDLEFVYPDVMN